MKTKFSILIACILSTVAFSGCKTASIGSAAHTQFIETDTNGIIYIAGHEVSPEIIAGTLSIGANIGASYEIKQDSNSREYFIVAKSVIDLAIDDGQYDPAVLKSNLSSISINELKNSEAAQKSICTVIDTYGKYFSTLSASKIANLSPYLSPMLRGISDGLAEATK